MPGAFRSIGSFARTYIALFRDGLRGQTKSVVLVWVLEGISALSQGLVVVTIANGVHYASTLTAGAGSTASGDGWRAQLLHAMPEWLLSTGGILLAVVALSTFFLMTAETSRFLAATTARKMARNYHQRLVARLLDRMWSDEGIRPRAGQDINTLRMMATRSAIHSSKAFEILTRAPQVAVFFLFFYTATFFLIWEASAALTIVSLILVPAAFYVSRGIHASAGGFFQNFSQRYTAWIGTLLGSLDAFYVSGTRANPVERSLFRTPLVRSFFDSFDGVQLASARMAYATGMVKAILFGTTLAAISVQAAVGNINVSVIVGYATALYITFSYLQNLFASLARLNVFYPQVAQARSAATFRGISDTKNSTTSPRRSGCETRDFIPAVTCDLSMPEMLAQASLAPGSCVDLVSPHRLGRFNAASWLAPLGQARGKAFSPGEFCLFNAAPADLSPRTVASLDRSLANKGRPSLSSLADDLGIREAYDRWQSSGSKPMSCVPLAYGVLAGMDPTVRRLFYLSTAIASEAPFVFLESNVLAGFPSEQRQAALGHFVDRFLMVWRLPIQDQPLECSYRFFLKDNNLYVILPGSVSGKRLVDTYDVSAIVSEDDALDESTFL